MVNLVHMISRNKRRARIKYTTKNNNNKRLRILNIIIINIYIPIKKVPYVGVTTVL